MSENKDNLVARIFGQNIYTSKEFEEKMKNITDEIRKSIMDRIFGIISDNIMKKKNKYQIKENECETVITSDFTVEISEPKNV